MREITIYRRASGEILLNLTLLDDAWIAFNVPPDCGYVDGRYRAAFYCIDPATQTPIKRRRTRRAAG